MIEILVAVGWFFLAAGTDVLSVAWQEARARRLAARCAHVAVLLEAMTWAPLLIVWQTGFWLVIVASLAGSWAGSYVAVRQLGERDFDVHP